MHQDLVVAPDAVIYGGTGATDAAVWWHRFLSSLGDAVFVAAAGYGTTASPAYRQDVGTAWVDVSRVRCVGMLGLGFLALVVQSVFTHCSVWDSLELFTWQ